MPVAGFLLGAYAAHKIGTKDGKPATLTQYLFFGSMSAYLFTAVPIYVGLSTLKKKANVESIVKDVANSKKETTAPQTQNPTT